MASRIPRAHFLAATVAALGLVAPIAYSPSLAHAARAISTPTPTATAQAASTPVTSTAGIQTVPSASGQTTIQLPRQVASGGQLGVLVHTLPRAGVQLTLGFPDGTTQVERRRASADGYARFSIPITYQPQGSAEALTVSVIAVQRAASLDDTVQTSVSVLQNIVLQSKMKLPSAVVAGRWLIVTVTSNYSGTLVRFRFTYPDGQVENREGGYIDASGSRTWHFPIASSDGTSGTLQVVALLSYGGVQKRIAGKVSLRVRNS